AELISERLVPFLLLVTAVLLVRMGLQIFNREELLGRDIDQLRIRWIFGLVWKRFTGKTAESKYPTVGQWYRQTFGIMKSLRQPMALLLIALAGAIFFGVFLSHRFPINASFSGGLSGESMSENLANLSGALAGLPVVIFLQNIRVAALQAILGIFTLGVSDVLIFMFPWALIGFLSGQLQLMGGNPIQFFVAAVLPHAVIELPALLISAAAILRWHATILSPPPNGTVGESWLLAAADFGRVFVGLVVPLLIAAAFVEAMVTPWVFAQVYG
ncbi:MAG: stage II sporulation protein M, partial [Candidatus Promineifilaceae bacterium]